MTGFSSGLQQVTAGGVVVAALSLLGLLIRQIGPWKKQATDAEANFRAELLARETLLTGRVDWLERTITRERRVHSAERALDRHRLNNITQCFDAMLLLIEMNPDRATEIVVKIKEMRATQVLAEAEEKAAIRVAEMADDDEDEAAEREAAK
jgi:hypothetical protein